MKTLLKNFSAVMAAVAVISTTSCRNQATHTSGHAADTTMQAPAQPITMEQAIERYLIDSIGSHYEKAALCIPECHIIATRDSNPDSIKVWGDFWVMNYNVAGDTLKTTSGGNHSGMLLLRSTDAGYEVTGMQQVADGSNYAPSAKRIFGEYYDQYRAWVADENGRKQARSAAIARYVSQNGLNVTCYQDFGWPAVPITAPSR
ncbi:MAG: hypothetical protein J6N71_09280 [Muribaculaceae bacterium]|nr:hypothetical protein [Muribaculaceae bacterium]